ncbi:hypothetical protein NXS98_10855 [Fontisphaera persica]|uniref:hypothetical protein n=1 Tax=Fontisphaera persica TaxID=2974023 RepID=UPI0024BF38F6|nr:hypothetical protein [Fontisphaera persica]WCJ58224.1 hypothetical protein NXS98_10855 [Fontisphaera persica]
MTTVGQASPPARPVLQTGEGAVAQAIPPAEASLGFWQLLLACLPAKGSPPEAILENAGDPAPATPHTEPDCISLLELQTVAQEAGLPLIVPPVPLPIPPGPTAEVFSTAQAQYSHPSPSREIPATPEALPGAVLMDTMPANTATTATVHPPGPTSDASPALEPDLTPAAEIQPGKEVPEQAITRFGPHRAAASAPAPAGGAAESMEGHGPELPQAAVCDEPTTPEMPSFTPSPRAGISSALPPERMVTHVESEKLAANGLQKVPAVQPDSATVPQHLSASIGGETGAAPQKENGEGAANPFRAAQPPELTHPAPTAPAHAVNGSAMPGIVGDMAAAEGLAHGTPAHPARLARVATEIQEMAVELLHFKADSMSVLIRPDADTALHLRLMVVAGRVYAEARLQSGDGAWLQSSWGDLQRVLADQNIVVEPLKYSSFHPQAGQWGADRPPQRSPENSAVEEPPAPRAALTPLAGNPPPKKRRTPTGWEWWA